LNYSKSDIWSVGLVFYQLLTNFFPYQGEDSSKWNDKDYRPIKHYSPHINLLAQRMVAIDVEKRLSARDVLEITELLLWGPKGWHSETTVDDVAQLLNSKRLRLAHQSVLYNKKEALEKEFCMKKNATSIHSAFKKWSEFIP